MGLGLSTLILVRWWLLTSHAVVAIFAAIWCGGEGCGGGVLLLSMALVMVVSVVVVMALSPLHCGEGHGCCCWVQ